MIYHHAPTHYALLLNNKIVFSPYGQAFVYRRGSSAVKCVVPLSGDTRVNEQISLTAIHNVWVRMHNRIANALRRLNRRASDEDIFQVGRAAQRQRSNVACCRDHFKTMRRRPSFQRHLHPVVIDFPTNSFHLVHDRLACSDIRYKHSASQGFHSSFLHMPWSRCLFPIFSHVCSPLTLPGNM